MSTLLWVILILGILLILYIYFKFFKQLKLRNIVFIDGTLGSGKTALSVNIAIRRYKKNLRHWKIKKYICFWNKKEEEKPILYSNIKLANIEYTPLTKELITRKGIRFNYKSVVLWDEISLSISQMDFKNPILNERLQEFFKLFRHETKGGYLICNSQSINDIHFSLKYVLTDYIYIHHKTPRFLPPLFTIYTLEERIYSADNTSITIKNEDIDGLHMKHYITRTKYFKYYDTYSYSKFTDNLTTEVKDIKYEKKDDLKSDYLLSYKELLFIYENFTEEMINSLPKDIKEHINEIMLNVEAYNKEKENKKLKKLGRLK